MPRVAVLFCFPWLLGAQLIPKGPNTPVVFLNGYQLNCSGNTFAASFGNADAVLQSNGIFSVFFNNCDVPGKPSLEALGIAFGRFLAGLKFSDGSAVSQVDVVAHSMGGLIVRSYLAGMQDTNPATFTPPATPGIRKAIFLATPQFGTGLTTYLGVDAQSQELTIGSRFLFDLNTWNDNTDDLRGVDALAVVGNGGTGLESFIPGFDDGLATLTSTSLGFARPGRTRVVPACHSNDSLFTALFLCSVSAPSIAKIMDSNNLVGRIVISFLTDTDQWRTLGQAIELNPLADSLGGVYLEAQDQNGIGQPIAKASVTTPSGTVNLSTNSGKIAYSESLPPAANLPVQVVMTGNVPVASVVKLPATTVLPQVVKPGPVIVRVHPAASNTFPLNVAPGEFVAIYGSNLSATVLQAISQPYPTQLGDVQVLVNGIAVPIQYAGPNQINVIYAGPSSGLTQLTAQNGSGRHTINLLVAPAVPAIFSLDGSGSGPAAALNGVTGKIVGPGAPLHAADYVALYLTGLGLTTARDGLDYAQIVPGVTIGGQNCPVTYAGRAPTIGGVDQINCRIPGGITPGDSVPVIVTSNGRSSNTVTLAIQ
jgi:uncharacterized protein (TIGR03437 family)